MHSLQRHRDRFHAPLSAARPVFFVKHRLQYVTPRCRHSARARFLLQQGHGARVLCFKQEYAPFAFFKRHFCVYRTAAARVSAVLDRLWFLLSLRRWWTESSSDHGI